MALRAETNNEPQPQQFVDPLSGKTYNRPTFADEVRGTEAKPIDRELALLARDSYQSHVRDRPEVEGWKPLTDEQLRKVGIDPKLLHDGKSGFDAGVYEKDGRYVVAFRGTDEAKDWKTNLGQGLGFKTTQYNLAVELGEQAKVAFDKNVVFVGHSLGGGLASAAMVATDTPGMTFNAAGLTDKSMKRMGLDPDAVREHVENGQIRNYQVKGEILTHVQEKAIPTRWLMADAIGRDMPLPDPDPLKGLHKINPFEKIPHRVDMHSMDRTIQAWDMKHGHLISANQPAQDQSGQNIASLSPANGDSSRNLFNARFEQASAELNPRLQALGLNSHQANTVTADLTLQTLRDGVTPARFDLATNNQRAFAIPEGESKPYSQVVIGESKDKSMIEIRDEATKLIAANPSVTAANPTQSKEQSTQDQANPEIGSIARGAR